jgi:hypothetical protein
MLLTSLERCSCGGFVGVEGGRCWLVMKDMDIPMIFVFVASSACRRKLFRRAEVNVGSEEKSLSDLAGRSGSVADANEVDRSIGTQGGKPWYEVSHGRMLMCRGDSTFSQMERADVWLVNNRAVLWRVGARIARMPGRLPGFSSVRVFVERRDEKVPMVFTNSGLPNGGLLGTLRGEGRCGRVPPELNCLLSGGKGRHWIVPWWTVRRSR